VDTLNVTRWKSRNARHILAGRLRHPWPFYRKAGGINAVVIHEDGSRDELGRVSVTYLKRAGWSVGTK
jgi:hypothetical protein